MEGSHDQGNPEGMRQYGGNSYQGHQGDGARRGGGGGYGRGGYQNNRPYQKHYNNNNNPHSNNFQAPQQPFNNYNNNNHHHQNQGGNYNNNFNHRGHQHNPRQGGGYQQNRHQQAPHRSRSDFHNRESHAQFNPRDYFKPSMLQDPWARLVPERQQVRAQTHEPNRYQQANHQGFNRQNQDRNEYVPKQDKQNFPHLPRTSGQMQQNWNREAQQQQRNQDTNSFNSNFLEKMNAQCESKQDDAPLNQDDMAFLLEELQKKKKMNSYVSNESSEKQPNGLDEDETWA